MSGPSQNPSPWQGTYGESHSPDIYTPQTAPQRKSSLRKWLLILGLVIGVPLGLVVLLVVAGGLFILSGKEEKITEADRSVVVTAQDLAPAMNGFVVAPQEEKAKKTRYPDKSFEVEYEYQHPDDEQPLYIKCTVTIDPNVSGAKTTYASEQIGINIGLSLTGSESKLETVEHNDWLRWGDDSKCSVLTTHRIPIGNIFSARKGTKIFSLMISGRCWNSAEDLQQLIQPKLDRLESYP